MKTKRITIKSLQKQLAEMTANRDHNFRLRGEEQVLVGKLRQQVEELDKGRDRAVEEREEARRNLHDHRAAVLEYFMVAANPETAKEVERLKMLQCKISGQPYYATPSPETPDFLRSRPRGY